MTNDEWVHDPPPRAECHALPRPCPLRRCAMHLLPAEGAATPSCAIDVADGGPLTVKEIGPLLGITPQYVQMIEKAALLKLAHRLRELEPEAGVAKGPVYRLDPKGVTTRDRSKVTSVEWAPRTEWSYSGSFGDHSEPVNADAEFAEKVWRAYVRGSERFKPAPEAPTSGIFAKGEPVTGVRSKLPSGGDIA